MGLWDGLGAIDTGSGRMEVDLWLQVVKISVVLAAWGSLVVSIRTVFRHFFRPCYSYAGRRCTDVVKWRWRLGSLDNIMLRCRWHFLQCEHS
jgi:hypothetical protein